MCEGCVEGVHLVVSVALPVHKNGVISQKVFIKLFCKSRFPHKSVNLSFLVTVIKKKLTYLCKN